MSPSILGTTKSLTVPNLGCMEGVEPLWISGLSWRPEFVHCDVALRCHDAKEMYFFPAWFCRHIARVISLLNSAIFLDHGIHSAFVLITSHRNGSSWSMLIQDTQLTCTTAFGTPDPLADIFHIHTTAFICLWISTGAQTSSVKNSTTDRCFIWKLVQALITNKHHCLRALNTELKLSTNTLHCIDYRMHLQTFLSSHY
jgi:hypothetical protein